MASGAADADDVDVKGVESLWTFLQLSSLLTNNIVDQLNQNSCVHILLLNGQRSMGALVGSVHSIFDGLSEFCYGSELGSHRL
jgi:hypothetical protein